MGRRQEPIIFLDTHILLWLYDKLEEKFSTKVKNIINSHEIYISPIVQLEVQYLKEINRIADNADTIIGFLVKNIGLRISEIPFKEIIKKAIKVSWTRD